MSYIHAATEITQGSGLSAHVLLSDDDLFAFFWPLLSGVSMPPPEEINGMQVRPVGVVGRTGQQRSIAFSAPIEYGTTDSIEHAWEAHCDTVNSLEVAELSRVFAFPDTRLN
jgi:hypothetical protein